MRLAMLVASLALTGCVSKMLESKNAEPQVYVLKAGNVAAAQVAYPVQLSLSLPTAAPGLNTNRIAVLRGTHQLDYFAGARWGASTPQVVQNFVLASLQASGGYKGVSSDSTALNADYLLQLQLQDFQAEYASDAAKPIVRVTLSGTLIDIKARSIKATLNSTSSVTAQDNRMGEVVTAYDTALQQATAQLSTQLGEALK